MFFLIMFYSLFIFSIMLVLYIFLFVVDDMYNCMVDIYGCRRRGLGKLLDLCFYMYMKYD